MFSVGGSAWGHGLELLLVGRMLTILKIKVKQEIRDFVEINLRKVAGL